MTKDVLTETMDVLPNAGCCPFCGDDYLQFIYLHPEPGCAVDLSHEAGPIAVAKAAYSLGLFTGIGFSSRKVHVDVRDGDPKCPTLWGYNELAGKSDRDLTKILKG